jgi:hypothetical protein
LGVSFGRRLLRDHRNGGGCRAQSELYFPDACVSGPMLSHPLAQRLELL